MKVFILRGALLLIMSTLVSASTPLESLRLLDGVEFVAASRFVVETDLQLNRATHIAADEVFISRPLITMGNRLVIETRRLVFEGEGKIMSFPLGSEAAKGPDGLKGGTGIHGSQGCVDYKTGQKRTIRVSRGGGRGEVDLDGGEVEVDVTVRRGEDGQPGSAGFNAEIAGAKGKDAGEIFISAAKVEGVLKIDGRGQGGGDGGRGGSGGSGGNGANGRNGKAGWFGFGGTDPCDGGYGGRGGSGGNGSNGGRGGSGALVKLMLGSAPTSREVETSGGGGGAGGAEGKPGVGGDGGRRGAGANSWLAIVRTGNDSAEHDGLNGSDPSAVHYPAQAMPRPGAAGQNGENGADGRVEEVLISDLESARVSAVDAFLEFHLERSFWALVEKTYSQIADELVLRPLSGGVAREFLSSHPDDLHEASLKEAEKINYFAASWQVFDSVFDEIDLSTSSAKTLKESYRLVASSLAILRQPLVTEPQLRAAQDALDQLSFRRLSRVESSLRKIGASCHFFLEKMKGQWNANAAEGWVFNRHFVIPSCLELDKLQNEPLMPLTIQGGASLLVEPNELSQYLKTQNVELYASRLKNPFAKLLLHVGTAVYADEPTDSIPLDTKWDMQTLARIAPEHLSMVFRNDNVVSRSGVAVRLHFLVDQAIQSPGDLEVFTRVNAFNWKALLQSQEDR